MTGKTRASWTWPDRVVIAGALIVAEATWASLLLSAAVNTANNPRVDLPFLALAVAAVGAVVAGSLVVKPGRPWWQRALVLAPMAVVGAALTAGAISELSVSGSFWAVATHPWTVAGHAAAVTAGVAWLVAILVWIRGVWLGVAPVSFRHAVWSAGLAAITFVGVFAGRASHHASVFRAATGAAGWLLFVCFPFLTAAVALVRERDLEKEVLSGAGSGPGPVWLAVLAVPMLVVAGVALAIAAVIGPAAPAIGRGVARGAEVIGGGVAAAVTWLWDLVPKTHPGTVPAVTVPGHGNRPIVPPTAPAGVSSPVPTVVWILVIAVLVAVAIALAVVVARHLRTRRVGWRRAEAASSDERDSVFSWRHLADQLWGTLHRLLRRMRRGGSGRRATPMAAVSVERRDAPESVREAYRRLLVAARSVGHARRRAETAREFQDRLSTELPLGPAQALEALTDLYDDARYGEVRAVEATDVRATGHADVISRALVDAGHGPSVVGSATVAGLPTKPEDFPRAT